MVFPISRKLPSSARVLAALFICFAISFPIGAEAGKKKQNRVQDHEEPAWVLPSHIQLKTIMAPITGASQSYALITLFIQAVSKNHVQKICFYRPRIVDTVLQVLSRHPIPVIRSKLDLSSLPAQILAPINMALGAEIVLAVYVTPWANARVHNNGLFSFAFSSCKTAREYEAAQKKAAATEESP